MLANLGLLAGLILLIVMALRGINILLAAPGALSFAGSALSCFWLVPSSAR